MTIEIKEDDVTFTVREPTKACPTSMIINKALLEDAWIPTPSSAPEDCSASLAKLLETDSFVIVQQRTMIEYCSSWTMFNLFTVSDSKSGNHLYYGVELTSCSQTFWCGGERHFEIHLFDVTHNQVLRIEKPCGVLSCRLMRMTVYEPKNDTHPENKLGTVSKGCNPFNADIILKDYNGQKIFKIQSNLTRNCCSPRFQIVDPQSRGVGSISQHKEGKFANRLSFSDTFVMNVPPELDIKARAVLLGALFLILDLMMGNINSFQNLDPLSPKNK